LREVNIGRKTGMEFYDVLSARRSIRDFTDEKIPEDKLRRIIEAAYRAPANDHFRDWHYIVVTDPDVKRKVLSGVPQNLTVEDVDQMTFISNPIQKKCYQVAVPKQYRMLYDADSKKVSAPQALVLPAALRPHCESL